MALERGTVLEFKCEDVAISDSIGRGSFGEVLKGKLMLTTDVAVKCVKVLREKRTDEAFEAEANTLYRLCHSGIVRLYGICKMKPDFLCLVMELCPHSLNKLLCNVRAYEEKLPVALQWRFTMEIAEAISFLHRQPKKLLHLDLKSDNILLTEDLRVKLCDFGLSVWQKFSTLHQSVHPEENVGRRGTRTHMAPEMLISPHFRPTSKCDVYSFSIVVWEILEASTDPYPNVRYPEQIDTGVGKNNSRPQYKFTGDRTITSACAIRVEGEGEEKDVVCALALLMRLCWSPQPEDRPSLDAILECLYGIGRSLTPSEVRLTVAKFLNKLDEWKDAKNKLEISEAENKRASSEGDIEFDKMFQSDRVEGLLTEVLRKMVLDRLPGTEYSRPQNVRTVVEKPPLVPSQPETVDLGAAAQAYPRAGEAQYYPNTRGAPQQNWHPEQPHAYYQNPQAPQPYPPVPRPPYGFPDSGGAGYYPEHSDYGQPRVRLQEQHYPTGPQYPATVHVTNTRFRSPPPAYANPGAAYGQQQQPYTNPVTYGVRDPETRDHPLHHPPPQPTFARPPSPVHSPVHRGHRGHIPVTLDDVEVTTPKDPKGEWLLKALTVPITTREMTAVSQTFKHDQQLEKLGHALELKEREVKHIKKQNIRFGYPEVAHAMLEEWKKLRGGLATKGMLYSVLENSTCNFRTASDLLYNGGS